MVEIIASCAVNTFAAASFSSTNMSRFGFKTCYSTSLFNFVHSVYGQICRESHFWLTDELDLETRLVWESDRRASPFAMSQRKRFAPLRSLRNHSNNARAAKSTFSCACATQIHSQRRRFHQNYSRSQLHQTVMPTQSSPNLWQPRPRFP